MELMLFFSAVTGLSTSSRNNQKHTGRIVGYSLAGAAGLLIICSVIYLWWARKEPGHMKIHTESPRKH